MNRQEYMEELKKKLSKLPKDDFDKAIDYFEEYFEDAGKENELQAIEDLGNPKEAADQIVRELAMDNERNLEAKNDIKKGLSGIWIAILAICASPIALPIVIAVIAIVFALVVSIVSVLFSFGVSGIALIVAAFVSIIAGFTMIGKSIPVFMVIFGSGLLCAVIGFWIMYASYLLTRKFFYWIVVAFSRMISKGGKKNEK